MTSTNGTNEVLKQDRRGRVRVSPERREALLAEYAGSGLSAAAFARLVGVKYATFATWVLKRRRTGGQGGAGKAGGTVQLLEAVVEATPTGRSEDRSHGGLWIDLPGGCGLAVATPLQLALAAELIKLVANGSRGC
jgi:transposase-like protein